MRSPSPARSRARPRVRVVLRNPAAGRDGGRPGANGAVRLASGKVLDTKSVHIVPAGDCIVLDLPGGGGMGDPNKRAPAKMEADLAAGFVTPQGRARDYE